MRRLVILALAVTGFVLAAGVGMALYHSQSGSRLARIQHAEVGLDLGHLLEGRIVVERVTLRGVRLALGSNAGGQPLWPTDLAVGDGGSGTVDLSVHDLELDDATVVYHDGVTGDTRRAWIEELRVDLGGDDRLDLEARGEFEGRPFQISGHLEPTSKALDAPYEAELEGRVADATLQATGRIAQPLALSGVDLALQMHLEHVPLPDDLGETLSFSPLEATARLTDPDDELRLEDVVVDMGRAGERIRLTGSVTDLVGDRTSELAGEVELASSRGLTPLFELELPEVGPVRGTFRLKESPAGVDLEGIDLEVGTPPGLNGMLTGRISDLTGLAALDLHLEARAPNLERLAPTLEARLRELGPVSVAGRIEGAGSALHVREIEAELGSERDLLIRARGHLNLLAGAQDLDLHVAVAAPATKPLETWLERELPEFGPAWGSGSVRGSLAHLVLRDYEVVLGQGKSTRLTLSGATLAIPPPPHFTLDAELAAPDLKALGSLVDRDLPEEGPVRVSGRVSIEAGGFSVHGLDARIDETRITGAVARVRDATGRGRTTLDLSAPKLHLDDVNLEPGQGSDEASGTPWRTRSLPVEDLAGEDVEVVLHFDQVEGRAEVLVDEFSMRLLLEHGQLEIDPLSFRWQGGQITAELRVNVVVSPPTWSLQADGRGIDLARLAAQFTNDDVARGKALVIADLESQGRTGQELIQALNGDFTMALRDGEIGAHYVLLLRSDLLRALALSPLQSKQAIARCFVGEFELVEGVAHTETLLLDGDSVIVHGQGSVDLAREKYDLVLTPKAKRPGIGLTQAVALRGTFAKPSTRPVPMALAKDAAKAVLGNLLLPGVGTIAPFLQTGTFGRDPCADALARFMGPA
jgi:hypothetical protein